MPRLHALKAVAVPKPRPHAAPATRLAVRFMTQFGCLRDACPDTCCRDWQVNVDSGAHDRISRVLNQDAKGRLLLQRAITLGGVPTRGVTPHAHIALEDGQCPFMEPSGLCGLHAQHGHDVLPDTCAIYPRTAIQVGTRIELHGHLSCPEVARLALLQEDALDLVDASALNVKVASRKVMEESPRDIYSGAFDDVRNAVFATLRLLALPFGVRLALLADLAERLAPFYFLGTAEFDGDRRELSLRRLSRQLSLTQDDAVMKSLQADLNALKVPLEPLLELLGALLEQRLRLASSPGFPPLVESVLASFGGVTGGKLKHGPLAVARYQQRRAVLHQHHGIRMERFLRNWSLLYWTMEPFNQSPTLLDHLCRMEIRLGMVHLLLLGHPQVTPSLDRGEPVPAQALSVAMTQSAQQWARAFDHHPNILDLVHRTLEAARPNTFGRAVCLGKLF